MMGKIVALGGGNFESGEMTDVAKHIVELTGKKEPRLLFLPTASFDRPCEDSPVLKVFSGLGCTSRILYLTHEDATEDVIALALTNSDIIYVDGGNLQFLMDTLKSTHADKYLRKAHENGAVLCGQSSGAMCWFKEGYDDCGENHSFIFYDCLDFIPYTSCPHYQSPSWQTFETAIKGRALSGVAMDNGAAFCRVDGKYYTICGSEGGNCYFYNKNDGFRKINLTETPSALDMLVK